MTEKKVSREGQGTFAQLYDVQEQLNRRNTKPLGRPPKKVQRKQAAPAGQRAILGQSK
jgi:hypothetical protein